MSSKKGLIEEAFDRFHAGDWDRAEALLRRAVDEAPDAPEPRTHVANLLRIRNRMDEAAPILEPLKDTPEITFEYRWTLFEAYRAAGDFPEACQIAERLRDDPRLDRVHRKEMLECVLQTRDATTLSRFFREKKDRNSAPEIRAILFIYRILRFFPTVLIRGIVRFWVRRFERRGRWRKVRVLLKAAMLADPMDSTWPRRLGQLCRRTRDVYAPDWDQERNWYRTALQIDPHDRDAQDGLRQTLFDMGRWSDVLEWAQRAGPDRHLLPRATCLVNLGQTQEAEDLYRDLENGESAVFARFCRSLIAYEQGRWEDARRLLVNKSDEPGLGVLVDFFRRVSRILSSGRAIEAVDGQAVLDEMLGVYPRVTPSVENRPSEDEGRCVLCGWQGIRVVLWRDQTTGWERVRCPQCTMISVNPLPSAQEIRHLYDHEERENLSLIRIYRDALLNLQSASPEACRQLPLYKEITEWGEDFCWNEYEKSISDKKRCLDLGCSSGYVVEIFRRCGWEAEGLDIDPQAVSFARSKGLNVSMGTVETLDYHSPRYHLVSLIDVIEHVRNPFSLVQRIQTLLHPGGLLYVKTPAADSLPHRFLGDRWLDSAEHLHFFSRRTLQSLLLQSGFEVVSFRQRTEPTTPFRHYDLWQGRLYPDLLVKWINRLRVGDVIRFLARKPS